MFTYLVWTEYLEAVFRVRVAVMGVEVVFKLEVVIYGYGHIRFCEHGEFKSEIPNPEISRNNSLS